MFFTDNFVNKSVFITTVEFELNQQGQKSGNGYFVVNGVKAARYVVEKSGLPFTSEGKTRPVFLDVDQIEEQDETFNHPDVQVQKLVANLNENKKKRGNLGKKNRATSVAEKGSSTKGRKKRYTKINKKWGTPKRNKKWAS